MMDCLFGRSFGHYDGFLEFTLWLHSFGREVREIFGYIVYYHGVLQNKTKKQKLPPVTVIPTFFFLLTCRGRFAWASYLFSGFFFHNF